MATESKAVFVLMTGDVAEMNEALKAAFAQIGGVRRVAKEFDLSVQAVYDWTRCPPKYVFRIEEMSGIPCWRLRPDIYPPSRFAPAEALAG